MKQGDKGRRVGLYPLLDSLEVALDQGDLALELPQARARAGAHKNIACTNSYRAAPLSARDCAEGRHAMRSNLLQTAARRIFRARWNGCAICCSGPASLARSRIAA